jgi:hypothetical protein
MKARLLGLFALVAALMLVPAATASAADAKMSPNPVPVTGKAENGDRFQGKFEIDHFAEKNGGMVAVGTLTGKLGNQSVTKNDVEMPVAHGGGATQALAAACQNSPKAVAAAVCPILNLTLGPLHLDLLGLVVDLNRVHLTITAQSGPGNLLGNLLCDIAGLLDNNSITSAIVAALNQALGL